MKITMVGNNYIIIIKDDNYPIIDIALDGMFNGNKYEINGVDEL